MHNGSKLGHGRCEIFMLLARDAPMLRKIFEFGPVLKEKLSCKESDSCWRVDRLPPCLFTFAQVCLTTLESAATPALY